MIRGAYVMACGEAGRERLRLLTRIMRPSTLALLKRTGIGPGMVCLDLGCGGGDVTVELARLTAPDGRVEGIDADPDKIALARAEARRRGIVNLSFRVAAAEDPGAEGAYDAVYARFLLTHLPDPAAVLKAMAGQARPGAVVIVEDIDFAGHFAYPDNDAFRRYQDWYAAAVVGRGGDPFIRPKLPSMAMDAGLAHVEANVVQPAGVGEEVKLIHPVTLEIIADAVIGAGLATRAELDRTVAALYAMARDGRAMVGMPRVVQVWARRP